MIVATAVDGEAEIIVTGDSHLLMLGFFRGIKIITVEEMLASLKE